MAKGKATPASFKPGDPRAVAAGKKSSRALPVELKEARAVNANKVEETLYKYMSMDKAALELAFKDPATPSVELIVIKIITKAISEGDYSRLDFLLNRTIGKVPDKTHHLGIIGITKVHDLIMKEIEGDD